MGKRLYRDIEIRGTVYPTAKAAAEALGVTVRTVQIAAKRGTLHRVGLGRKGAEPMPVEVRGVVYPNAKVAARRLGLTAHAVYQAIAAGRPHECGLRLRHNSTASRPVTIGNLTFSSMEQAGRELGFGHGYVSQVMRRRSKIGHERLVGAAMREAARRAENTRKGAA